MSATIEKPATNGLYLSAEQPNPTPPDTDSAPPPKAPAAPVPVLDRAAAQVARVAAKDDARPVLSGVCLRNGEAVAADGFVLAACTLAKRSPDDYPAGYAPVDPDGLLIPARVVAHFGKANRLRDRWSTPGHMRFGGTVPVTSRGPGDASVVLAAPSPVEAFGNTTTETRSIEGAFPDYDQIFYEGEPVASFTLNPQLVINLMQMYVAAGKAAGTDTTEGVTFHYYGPGLGVAMCAPLDEGRRLDAVIMPMQVEASSERKPRKGTGKVPEPQPRRGQS